VAGYLGGRQHRAVQTADLETQIAERVVQLQEVEATKLAKRIEELQLQIDDLKTRYAQREQELMGDLEPVRGERDSLRAEVSVLHSHRL
jgi:predicted  nucleic acid-binding Zn-ribbon protein